MSATLKVPEILSEFGQRSAAEWAQLGARLAPKLLTGLGVLLIAWQAARLTWLFLAPAPTVAPAAAPTTINTPNRIDPQQIASAHLFGAPGSGSADPNSLPQNTSLVLAGTMALDDPQAGFAIVGESAANAKFYRVGASLSGGARLHSVYTDRVIIERNGQLETLVLPRGTASTAIISTPRTAATPSTPGDNLRRSLSNNPSALGDLMRAQPVFANGVQKGYRVYPGRERQQFTRIGLQPGDLVTAINGSTLDDPARGTEILNTLTSSTTAQVTVERNGVSQVLSLDMSQLSLPDSGTDGSATSGDAASTPSSRNGGFGPPGSSRNRNRGPGSTNEASAE